MNMIIPQIAFRNIFRDKKRTFSLGITYTIVAIILMLLLSFTNGVVINFGNNLSKSFVGHLNIYGQYKENGKIYDIIPDYIKIEKIVKQTFSSKTEIYPRISMFSRISNMGYTKSSNITGVIIERERDSIKSQIKIINGNFEDFVNEKTAVLIPQDLADYFEFTVNDEFMVSTKTIYGAYNTATFIIKGIYKNTNPFSQNMIYSHFEYLQNIMLFPENSASTLLIFTESIKGADDKRMILIKELSKDPVYMVEKPVLQRQEGGFRMSGNSKSKKIFLESPIYKIHLTIFTLEEILSALNQMIDSVRIFAYIITIVMLLIIGISLYVNIRMTINDQMREIGTMRTIGLSSKKVVSLYIYENIFLAIIFTIAGILISLFLILLSGNFITFNPPIEISFLFDKGHLVLVPKISEILGILLVLAIFSAIFSYIPSRYAGKIKPIDALNAIH
ncbi:MAG: ABC transporter permease [Exilispira sp.]